MVVAGADVDVDANADAVDVGDHYRYNDVELIDVGCKVAPVRPWGAYNWWLWWFFFGPNSTSDYDRLSERLRLIVGPVGTDAVDTGAVPLHDCDKVHSSAYHWLPRALALKLSEF